MTPTTTVVHFLGYICRLIHSGDTLFRLRQVCGARHGQGLGRALPKGVHSRFFVS